MKTVKLGTIESSQLGYGCMSLSSNIYKTDDGYTDEHGIKVIKRALELGITHFDTALIYGVGHNETLVGKALAGISKEERAKLCVATKTGFDLSSGFKISGAPDFVKRTAKECSERLGTYIDIFYLHRIDTETPIEETMKALKELVDSGIIKAVGLSEASAKTIERAHAVHPIAAVQLEWSLWSRDVEAEIIPTCRKLGIGIVAYSPLGRGVLTGAIKKREDIKEGDWRLTNPRFQEEALDQNVKLVEKLENMAKQKGGSCTAGKLALAWVMAQGDDVVPIPGTSKIENLEKNVDSVNYKLTKEEVDTLSSFFPPEKVVGGRYDENHPTFDKN